MLKPLAYLIPITLIACTSSSLPKPSIHAIPAKMPFSPHNYGGFLLGLPLGITSSASQNISTYTAGAVTSSTIIGLPRFDKFPSDWLPNTANKAAVPNPIAAMSLGIDVINVEELNGRWAVVGETAPIRVATLAVPPGGWMALVFSVQAAEVGPGPLAPAVSAAATAGQLDASVFNYLVPGSAVVPAPDLHKTKIARSPSDFGLSGGRLNGLNMHMALYDSGLAGPGSSFFTRPLPPPKQVRIYFTLRPAYVEWMGRRPQDKNEGNESLSSGWIYESEWKHGSWTPPKPYLKVDSKAVVDGLAMDRDANGDREIIFSVRDAPAARQLEYMSFAADGSTKRKRRRVVIKQGATRHSAGKRLGAGRGIGDVCTGDPKDPREKNAGGLESVVDDFFVGRRHTADVALKEIGITPPTSPTTHDLSVSSFRQIHAGKPHMVTNMFWPTTNADPKGKGELHWFLISDYAQGPGDLVATSPDIVPGPNWTQISSPLNFEYKGTRLTASIQIPKAPSAPGWKHAIAAQWILKLEDGTQIFAPTAVMRMYPEDE